MAVTNTKKMSYEELFNSTTMFYINKDCEKSIKDMIDMQTADILVGLKTITSKETITNRRRMNNDFLRLAACFLGGMSFFPSLFQI